MSITIDSVRALEHTPDPRTHLQELRKIVAAAKTLPGDSADRQAVLDETHRQLAQIRHRIREARETTLEADTQKRAELDADETQATLLEREILQDLRGHHTLSRGHATAEVRNAADAVGRIARSRPGVREVWSAFRKEDIGTQSLIIGVLAAGSATVYGTVTNWFRKAEQKSGAVRWMKRTALTVAGSVGLLWLWHLFSRSPGHGGQGTGGSLLGHGTIPKADPFTTATERPDVTRTAAEAVPAVKAPEPVPVQLQPDANAVPPPRLKVTKPVAGALPEPDAPQRISDPAQEQKPPVASNTPSASGAATPPEPRLKYDGPPEKEVQLGPQYHRERITSGKTVRIQIMGAESKDPPFVAGKAFAIRDAGTGEWKYIAYEELLEYLQSQHRASALGHVEFYARPGFALSTPKRMRENGGLIDRIIQQTGVPVTMVAEMSDADAHAGQAFEIWPKEAILNGERLVTDPRTGEPVQRFSDQRHLNAFKETEGYRTLFYFPTQDEYLRSLHPVTIRLLPGKIEADPVIQLIDLPAYRAPMTVEKLLSVVDGLPDVRAVVLDSDSSTPKADAVQKRITASGRLLLKRAPGDPASYTVVGR